MNDNQEIIDFLWKKDKIKIDMKTFKNCTKLTKIKIPNHVKKIGMCTFEDCTSLTEVVFEEQSSLLFICSLAFLNCISLKKITIPSKVLMIGKHAFSNCKSLTEITISSNTIIVDELSYDSLNIKRVQSQHLENEYEKALSKIVTMKLPETDIQNCIDDNDTVLDQIVDAFKKFPYLYNAEHYAIMAKLSELGLGDEIKKYFLGFYYSNITIYIQLPTGHTSPYTFKEDDEVEALYKEMYDRFFDGINEIKMIRKDISSISVLPRSGTFKENKVENNSKMTYMQTMLGG